MLEILQIFNEMLKNAFNKDNRKVNYCLTISRLHKFNSSLMNIAGNNIHAKTFKLLIDCKVSQNLLSNAYALLKDQKEGKLKGRRIISTTNS